VWVGCRTILFGDPDTDYVSRGESFYRMVFVVFARRPLPCAACGCTSISMAVAVNIIVCLCVVLVIPEFLLIWPRWWFHVRIPHLVAVLYSLFLRNINRD